MVTQHPTNTTPQTFLSLYKKQGPQTTRAARSGRQRIGILFKRATYDHCPQAVGTARPRSAVSVPWRDSGIMCAIPGGSSPPWPDPGAAPSVYFGFSGQLRARLRGSRNIAAVGHGRCHKCWAILGRTRLSGLRGWNSGVWGY